MYEIFEKLIKQRGITSYRVSKETGVSQTTLSEWRKGTYIPKIDKLIKIADFFDVSVDYLMGKEKYLYRDSNNFILMVINHSDLSLEHFINKTKIPKNKIEDYLHGTPIPEDDFFKVAKALDKDPRTLCSSPYQVVRYSEIWQEEKTATINGSPSNFSSTAIPYSDLPDIPVVGAIHAGKAVLAVENIIGYEKADVKNPGEYFYLNVEGDCMIGAGIANGSRVLIHKQNCAENGQIVACLVDGEAATLKRYTEKKDTVVLTPANPSYEPIIVSKKDFDSGYAKILGVAKKVLTDL